MMISSAVLSESPLIANLAANVALLGMDDGANDGIPDTVGVMDMFLFVVDCLPLVPKTMARTMIRIQTQTMEAPIILHSRSFLLLSLLAASFSDLSSMSTSSA